MDWEERVELLRQAEASMWAKSVNYSAIASAYDAARDATACAAAALTAAARAASAPYPAVVDSGLAMARLPGSAIRQC